CDAALSRSLELPNVPLLLPPRHRGRGVRRRGSRFRLSHPRQEGHHENQEPPAHPGAAGLRPRPRAEVPHGVFDELTVRAAADGSRRRMVFSWFSALPSAIGHLGRSSSLRSASALPPPARPTPQPSPVSSTPSRRAASAPPTWAAVSPTSPWSSRGRRPSTP